MIGVQGPSDSCFLHGIYNVEILMGHRFLIEH